MKANWKKILPDTNVLWTFGVLLLALYLPAAVGYVPWTGGEPCTLTFTKFYLVIPYSPMWVFGAYQLGLGYWSGILPSAILGLGAVFILARLASSRLWLLITMFVLLSIYSAYTGLLFGALIRA